MMLQIRFTQEICLEEIKRNVIKVEKILLLFHLKNVAVHRYRYTVKIVFEQYDPPHCVVCGETTEELLEAAHYVAVKAGGADIAENGLCLCSIHHKLCSSA